MWPVTAVAAATCAGMIACVLTGAEIKKLHIPLYILVTLAGAAAMLVFGFLPAGEALRQFTADTAVNPLKILALFLCITMLSVFLDETGFFQYMASVALKKAGNSQIKLFIVLYVVVSVLTMFTSNDIIILTFTPFICYFCRAAKIQPLPFLMAEFVAANTFSMMLLIGNPTNIYLSLSEGITFGEYLKNMWLATLLAGVAAFFVMFAIFYKKLKVKIECGGEEIARLDKPLAVIGGIHLAGCTVMLAVSDIIGAEMWIIALAFAACLFLTVGIYKAVRREHFTQLALTLKRAPWSFVPFLLSMFIIVAALEYNGVTAALAKILGGGSPVPIYGALSALACNLVNNIPMSVLFGSVLSFAEVPASAAYACIIGSNIGAYFTPVGALAGIMFGNILKGQGVKLGFGKFVLCGTVVALPALAAALSGLVLIC